MKSSKTIVESYLKQNDWRVKENSNAMYSYGALCKYTKGEVFKDYWLREIYPENISQAYIQGDLHIHDLGDLTLYCCGYSLRSVLMKGVKGVGNVPTSSPAKHFSSILNQLANITTIFQNEIAGAVAFNSVDTLLAPFIKYDKLTYDEVKQAMQNYIFSVGSNSRGGAEPAFSNCTFDLTPPEDLFNEYAIIGGEFMSFTYGSCQQEIDMFNRAFFELMYEGDSKNKLFSYPIPTYNIHSRFDWDNPNNKMLWEMAGKYGIPYFANFLNSDLEIRDVRSMCPLTGDTLILTKSKKGIYQREIKELYNRQNIKDTNYQVWDGNKWCNAKINKQNNQTIYKVTLSNGTVVKMGENHLQPTKNYLTGKLAKELKVGDWLPFNKNEITTDNLGNYGLGFVVGAYVGDGSNNGKAITYSLDSNVKDDLTRKKITKFWSKIGYTTVEDYGIRNCTNLRINGNPYELIERYVKGDNALNKELTHLCFEMSNNWKIGFIDGLVATDGSRDKNRYYTSSFNLTNDLISFFNTFGHKALISSEDNRENRLGNNTNYCISIPNRKSYANHFTEDNQYNYYSVIKIEVLNNKENLFCFEVDNENHLFMLANGLITHNCRLNLDLTQIRKKNGGLFGAGDSTGSIGVVTINLPRIGYLSTTKDEFFERLDKMLNIAKDSLEIKRKWLEENVVGTGLIPAFDEYVGTIDNHFSTIGVVGENEMCENFLGKNILSDEGKQFAIEVGNYINQKLLQFQKETEHLYNFEATPAESTCYRLALSDKNKYSDITTQGKGKDVYYTNSCHIPVKYIESIDSTFKHQDDLQTQFSGGTVIHIFLEGGISGEQAKSIIKSVCTKYRTPYVSLSPISRYCPEHGYIKDITDKCPICKKKLKLYQRITGYLRCVDNFNKGKLSEFKDRKQLKL